MRGRVMCELTSETELPEAYYCELVVKCLCCTYNDKTANQGTNPFVLRDKRTGGSSSGVQEANLVKILVNAMWGW